MRSGCKHCVPPVAPLTLECDGVLMHHKVVPMHPENDRGGRCKAHTSMDVAAKVCGGVSRSVHVYEVTSTLLQLAPGCLRRVCVVVLAAIWRREPTLTPRENASQLLSKLKLADLDWIWRFLVSLLHFTGASNCTRLRSYSRVREIP